MRILLLFFSLFLFIQCNNEDPFIPPPPELSFKDIDVVTGITFRDAQGQLVGQWRNPNDFTGPTVVFPNPVNDVASILSVDLNVKKIWVVNAQCLNTDEQNPLFLEVASLEYSVEELNTNSIKALDIDPVFNLDLNLSDLRPGFYRIFIQLENDDLHWNNVFVDPDVNLFTAFEMMDNSCP